MPGCFISPDGTPSHRHLSGGSRGRGLRSLLLLVPVLLLVACSGSRPATLGLVGTALAPCPNTPNCVHTGDRYPGDVAPLTLAPIWVGASTTDLWPLVVEAVQELPRTEIITQEPGYLHAESTSRIFRFVDDLEVHHDRVLGELVVRSASRMGRSDLGVNAERVETLRAGLLERGVVVPVPGLAGRF
jgi:uncharacterized protein (DUF1499 family)